MGGVIKLAEPSGQPAQIAQAFLFKALLDVVQQFFPALLETEHVAFIEFPDLRFMGVRLPENAPDKLGQSVL